MSIYVLSLDRTAKYGRDLGDSLKTREENGAF